MAGQAIVAVAGNPALALFIEAVGDLDVTRLAGGRARLDPPPTRAEGLAHLDGYRPVVAAITDGDGEAAARRTGRLIDAVATRLRDARPRRLSRIDELTPGIGSRTETRSATSSPASARGTCR